MGSRFDAKQLRMTEAKGGALGPRASKNLLRFFQGANEYGPQALQKADAGIKSSAAGVMGSLAGAGGGIGDKMLATGNPYAMAGGAVLKFASGLSEAAGKVREWGDHLHEQNRTFAEFSGSMAAVMAQDDARRIWLQREQGERRAGFAKELAEARFRLDSTMAPIEDAFANFKNNAVAKLTGVVEDLAVKFSKLLPVDLLGGSEDLDMTSQGHLWLETFAAEQKEIEKRRPKRMQ